MLLLRLSMNEFKGGGAVLCRILKSWKIMLQHVNAVTDKSVCPQLVIQYVRCVIIMASMYSLAALKVSQFLRYLKLARLNSTLLHTFLKVSFHEKTFINPPFEIR